MAGDSGTPLSKELGFEGRSGASGRAPRNLSLAAGLVDDTPCAIAPTRSGLRVTYRLADRSREG
jgi:hypothetical protein